MLLPDDILPFGDVPFDIVPEVEPLMEPSEPDVVEPPDIEPFDIEPFDIEPFDIDPFDIDPFEPDMLPDRVAPLRERVRVPRFARVDMRDEEPVDWPMLEPEPVPIELSVPIEEPEPVPMLPLVD